MEEEFFDLGFVDSSILDDVPEIKDEPATQEDSSVDEPTEEYIDKTEEEDKPKDGKEPRVKESPLPQENSSPNISSSIAQALVDEGVLQTLNEERISKITDTESLIEAFREDQRNQLDEIQKRVYDAMSYGVEPTRIQQYENWLKTLNDVTDSVLEGEEESNENYRKNLIYQHYLSKGFDKDDALEMVERSVESGKDIDDAKKALTQLKTYYQKAYDDEINEAKKQHETYVENQKKQYKALKDSILEDDKDGFFEQFEIGKTTRHKIFDVVAKPSVADGDNKITPLQKFIKDDPNKANKIIGTLYVITEGFTKFDGILKGTVKKQVRDSVKNLERTLNQMKPSDGSMEFKSGLNNDIPNVKLVDFDFD